MTGFRGGNSHEQHVACWPISKQHVEQNSDWCLEGNERMGPNPYWGAEQFRHSLLSTSQDWCPSSSPILLNVFFEWLFMPSVT